MKHKDIPLLNADDIEVRIQQACKGNKALALLYKTSRTDMRILDQVFGMDGWKDDYKEIRGNLYCGISIFDDEKDEWITKWDCGIESQQGDGNEKKAEASDAFKRAGTKIGIGRELYTSPLIFINAETKEVQSTGKLKFVLTNPYEKYSVLQIDYNDKREIKKLVIVDSKNTVVYSYGIKETLAPVSNKPTQGTPSKKSNTQEPEQQGLTVLEALEYEFEMKGKIYRLADCPLDWCRKQYDRDNISEDMRERLKLVIGYKQKHGENA